MGHGFSPDRNLVPPGAVARRSVDDQVDLPVLDQVHDIRPSLVDFINYFHGDPVLGKGFARPAGGHDLKSKVLELFSDKDNGPLILILHADEDFTLLGKELPGSQLGLGKSDPESMIDAHDFARGFHFRAQNRVHPRKTVERKYGLLHGNMTHFHFPGEIQFF